MECHEHNENEYDERQIIKYFNQFYARKYINNGLGWQDIYLDDNRYPIDPYVFADFHNISVLDTSILKINDAIGVCSVNNVGIKQIYIEKKMPSFSKRQVLAFILGYLCLTHDIDDNNLTGRTLFKYKKDLLQLSALDEKRSIIRVSQLFAEAMLLPEFRLREYVNKSIREESIANAENLSYSLVRSAMKRL